MNKVIFFGVGKHAHYILKNITAPQFSENQYIAFSDNNSALWGETFNGLKIVSPLELNQTIADFFVITSTYYEQEIQKQLVNEIGIPKEKVYSFDEYARRCYAKWQYKKKYGDFKNANINECGFNLKKTVVYTAITDRKSVV